MGEAVPTRKIAEALELEVEDVYAILKNMKDKYDELERGVMLIEIDESFQMCTKREHYEAIKKVNFKLKEFVLTDVLIETLSIVAYKQPVTRAEIESVRGVNSNHAVNKLVEYNLVCEIGRLDVPGRPIQFGTTKDFLRGFGLQSVEELPELGAEALNNLKQEVEKEMQLTLIDGDIEDESIDDIYEDSKDRKLEIVTEVEQEEDEAAEAEFDLDNFVLTIDEI
jgi:segregation and condensation protein B